MNGKFYAVGVGCGDPELLTLKAVRIIKECDIIAVPIKKDGEQALCYEIVKQAIPEVIQKQRVNILMPMIKDMEKLKKIHTEGAEQIEKLLTMGKNIAFLTIGDVCIYSTAIYIFNKIKSDGFCCEIISGVPSFCSMAGKLGISLCQWQEKLHIIPSLNIDTNDIIKKYDGNFVFMKAGRKVNSVIEDISNNFQVETAYLAENINLEDEKIVDLKSENIQDTGYFSIIVAKKSEEK